MREIDHTGELARLIARLTTMPPSNGRNDAREAIPVPIGQSPGVVTTEFVRAFLVWEAGHAKAAGAAKRIAASIIDCNELRICLEDDIAGLLGARYPRCRERAARLRTALQSVYDREHTVSLEHLCEMPKRDSRAYLASLDGTPPFVAARVSLLALGAHAFPLDERLHARLAKANATPPSLEIETAGTWLERQFRAGEIESGYMVLEAWADEPARAGARETGPAQAGDRPGVRAENDA